VNEIQPIFTFALIGLTSVFSFIGFQNPAFCEKHLLSVPEILAGKQYRRIITAAFLHADWPHLVLNMVSLYLFGRNLELHLGAGKFLLIYFASVIGGSLLSLWIHRHHEYRAYGASGGVCGVIFGYIALFPGASIASFPLPVPIPAWLYAILFFVGSFLALKRQSDNIGHDAHLGGAIVGMWTTVAIEPAILEVNLRVVVAVSILAGLLLAYLAWNPLFLSPGNFFPRKNFGRTETSVEDSEAALNRILEKISKTGIGSLTAAEKKRLQSASEKFRRS
jgi:membrane associated rhomboid family serine protease